MIDPDQTQVERLMERNQRTPEDPNDYEDRQRAFYESAERFTFWDDTEEE